MPAEYNYAQDSLKTRLRAFVRKFSPSRAPPHEVVIRGISQDYFGRQINASLSPLSTLQLEIAVMSNCIQRLTWAISSSTKFLLILVSITMTTHSLLCGWVVCGVWCVVFVRV